MLSDPFANIDSDHFPVLTRVRLALGAKRQVERQPRWDFKQVSEEAVTNMNKHLDTQLDTLVFSNEPSQRWDALREVYLHAITNHVPVQTQQPRKDWISQAILNLISARGDASSQDLRET